MSKQLPWVRFFASDWLAGTRGLSAAETGVYITLCAVMYERGDAVAMRTQADEARLARLCGASLVNFRRSLAVLVDNGKIIEREDGLWNHRVEEEMRVRAAKSAKAKSSAESMWERRKKKPGNAGVEPPTPSKTTLATTPRKSNGHGKASENNDLFKQSQSERSATVRANPEPDSSVEAKAPTESLRQTRLKSEFSEWYRHYPHKVGKQDAERAFPKARKAASLDELIAGVKRYVAAKPGDRPWRNPATWLNGQCWLDEPAAAPIPQARGQPAGFSDVDQQARAGWDTAWANAIEKDKKKNG